jgi:hypothetical protein
MQLKMNGRFIPNEPFDTTSIAHLQDQNHISSLDGALNSTADFENSIVLEHNQPDGTRWANCLQDDSSYLCQFQTERSDAAFVVDGVNTGGKNIAIELNSTPKYSGALDTYFLPDPSDLTRHNICKPFCLEVRDTLYLLTASGL